MPTYSIELVGRSGAVHHHTYSDDDGLRPGSLIRVEGRDLLVSRIEPGEDGRDRLLVAPARYRMLLRHPDGREEPGAMRRFRDSRPGVGHAFSTVGDGRSVSWQVTDERLATDDHGEPFLELVAERDYAEYDQTPSHELEHALTGDGEPPAQAVAVFAQAAGRGLAVELAALEPGEVADWDEAQRYIDALVVDELDNDLMDLCRVDFSTPEQTWLAVVKDRLTEDLRGLCAEIEGGGSLISQWEFRDGRVYASVGSMDEESEPASPHGWMCRLLDSGALAAAGFTRVRKAELVPDE